MELCDHTALALSRMLRKKEVTSREITASVLERIDKNEKDINAFITLTPEMALEQADRADRIWQLPRIIPAKDGQDFFIDGDDDYWRAISLIASAHSYEQVQSMEHAHEAGFVLGQFQRVISDIPVEPNR